MNTDYEQYAKKKVVHEFLIEYFFKNVKGYSVKMIKGYVLVKQVKRRRDITWEEVAIFRDRSFKKRLQKGKQLILSGLIPPREKNKSEDK